MKNVKYLALCLMIGNLLLFSPAWGDETAGDDGEKNSGEMEAAKPKPVQMDEVVVTATKYESSTKDIPSNVTVVTGEEIRAQFLPNNDIGDALRNISGLTTRRAYAPFPAYINIRGVGNQGTVILVNNIPTNWEITQAIPPGNIERVEIMRGPASALYGANASGGVINIITKEGGEGINGSMGGGYGTFNTWRVQAATDGTVDKFHYSFAGYKDKSDGTNIVKNTVLPSVTMIEDCSYDKWAGSLTAAYDVNEKGKLSFLFNYFKDEYTRGRPNVGGDWDRYFTSLIYDQAFGDMFLFKGYVGFRYDDLLHRYDKGNQNYELRQTRDTDYREIPLELQLTAKLGFGNALTGGFFYNYQDTDQAYHNPAGDLINHNRYKVRTVAGYLQDVWKPLDKLAITAGLRYDNWQNYDNTFTSYVDEHPGDRTDDNWSPKIGAKYNFTDRLGLWANYAVGFNPPTPEQLYDDRTSGGNPREPNPNLQPETTRSWELGVENWFTDTLSTKMVGFFNYTDDKIISWFNDENIWINKNIGRSKSYGVELDMFFQPTENWIVNANGTWNPAEIDSNPSNPGQEGNELPFSPKYKANLSVTYQWVRNFELSGFFRYLSKQQTNEANTEYTKGGEARYMPSSFVVDFKGVKHFPVAWGALKNIDVALAVDNVFNANYRTFYIYEDPGRTFFGEVKFFF